MFLCLCNARDIASTAPVASSRTPLSTDCTVSTGCWPGLRKCHRIYAEDSGWGLFQQLLAALDQIAKKYRVSIANVGVRYILNRPAVAGVIGGARLGVTHHIDDNARVFTFTLDAQDEAEIEAVLAQSRDLFALIGDCGDEYR